MITYFWDFGDGYSSTEENPSHVYRKTGRYIISLTITDTEVGVASTTKINYVIVVPATGLYPYKSTKSFTIGLINLELEKRNTDISSIFDSKEESLTDQTFNSSMESLNGNNE